MAETADDLPRHRYDAALAQEIEARWQDRWEADGTFHTPNPVGDLSEGFAAVADRPKRYVLDMFPYPSGVGLHVGHPLGYIGTDVYARYLRMTGHNVMHTMGYDSFGLPAEQYALATNTHPRVTTEANIATMRRQLRRLGLAHDPRRSISTTDERVKRTMRPIVGKPKAKAGIRTERKSLRPEVGNQRSLTEKTIIITSANQKVGIVWPKRPTPRPMRSLQPPGRPPPAKPSGIPMTTAMINATKANSSEAGKRSSTNGNAGVR